MDEIKEETVDYVTNSNDDGLPDYYTKLICEGKIRNTAGNVLAEWIGFYDEVQSEADIDGDGLLNGEEIQIVEKNGKTMFKIITNPEEYDSDFDGLSDGEEKKKETDPWDYNIYSSHVDYLTNNEIYTASIFSEQYLDDWWLRTQVGLGNAIANFKVSHVDDYKQALMEYIKVYNEISYDEQQKNYLIEFYESNLNSYFFDLVDLTMTLDDIAAEASGYEEALQAFKESKKQIKDLKKSLKSVDDYLTYYNN